MKKLFFYLFPVLCFVLLGAGRQNYKGDIIVFSVAQEPTTQDVYAQLRNYIGEYWNLSQHTSDETFVPPRITTRGSDWVDNLVWLEMQEHSWDGFSPASGNFRFLWDDSFKAINLANEVLQDLQGAAGTETEQAEMKVLRAFFYYQLMDFFGGVPILEIPPLPNPLPTQNTRKEVFDFIEAELLDAIPNLADDPTGANYGKVSKWAAYSLLAKLYLNAEVYSGTGRWQDCIDACDVVINSGWYNLAPNYFDNFILNNEASPENIFVIPFSPSDPPELQSIQGMNLYMRTLHYNQLTSSPWNGFTTLADFYNTFDPSDLRMGDTNNGMIHQGFLIGQQKDDFGVDLNDRLGNPLIFTLEVPLDSATESEGVRVLKYEADKTALPAQGENDYAIFRFGDILLSKAEGLLRLGNSSEALILVNQVRERAFDPDNPLPSITLDDILKERGFELYWEGFRRQDLIRFGKFNDAWTNKGVTPSYTQLLPIPQVVLDRNPDLVQNTDYDFLQTNPLDQSFTRINSGADVNADGDSQLSNWIDYNNDGYLDLFVINWGGESNSLYRNNGDGTFIKITNGPIVNDIGNSHYCSWGDYDNDGYGDLFVSNWDQSNFLYRNNGDGTFIKITAGAIVTDVSNSHGSAWGDYNNDGYLDLFVANRSGNNNFLYQNNGNGTFTKITSGDIVNDGGNSFSGNWTDYNNDGHLDLFVANGGWDLEEDNFLYKNNGDGTFSKITAGIVVTDGGKSFGANWVDYDNDGDLDLFVVSDWPDKDRLYINNGDGTFTKNTSSLIVQEGNSFYSNWVDYDNDGDLDLYIIKDFTNGPLFQNNGDGTFSRISFGNIINDDIGTKGFSWGDYDNDGDMDLFVAHSSTLKNSFFSNDGNLNNWINIKCVGTLSNTFAIGTKVKVKAKISGIDVWQLQEVSGQTGGGLGSQNSLNAEFGLGDASIIDSIKIEWTSGLAEVFENVLINQFVIAVEGNSPPKGENDLVTTDEDTAVEIAVLDNDTDADGDNLTLQIDDQSVNGTAIINTDNTITYTPDANFNGNDSFSYIISDGSLGGSDTLTVSITIDTINDAPTFTKGEDITVNEDAGAQSMAWATDIDDGDDEIIQILTFEIVSVSDTDMFGAQPAIANDGTLTFTSAPNENGTATITIKLKDDGGTTNGGIDESATESFDIIVIPVNDAPIFTKGPDITLEEDAGAQSMAWATAIDDGDDEIIQILTFEIVSVSDTDMFGVQPAIANDGTLTFASAPNKNGTATITIKLKDDGGTTNGGIDENATESFDIIVIPVNDAPVFTKGPDITLEEDAGAQSMAWATAIDDGDDEVTQILTFEIDSVSDTALFGVQPAIANDGTLTFTSAPNENGTATITIKLKDDGGTANGGIDESASQTFTINITPVNDAPTVAVPIQDQNPIYEFTFTFNIGTFVDIEDSQLTYTATLADDSPLPTWLTFDGLTRTFSGTPEVGEGSFIIKVTATDSGGLSVSDEFTLNFLITGSEESNLLKKIIMYPNPATGDFDLLIYDAYTGDVNISVMDNNGRILFTERIYKPASELRHTIDLSGKSNGIYFIRVQTGNREILLRAVKH